jgi:hypothetical protein
MNLKRLKRFDPNKHQQLEEFIAWVRMMGLTGRDLISLGGQMDRMDVRDQALQNRAIVEGMQLDPVGSDRSVNDRWTIKTINGRYRFDVDYHSVYITSYKTKKRHVWHCSNDYELGKMHWRKRTKYEVMLDWHHGKLLLNF